MAYSYNPQELEQSVTLRVPGGLSRKDVPEFLSFVLASRGFTTVRTPGSPVISVVKMEAAAGLARASKDAGDSGGAAFVTQVVKTKHQTPKALVEAIKGALSKTGGSVAALGESSYLIISDLGPRVDESLRSAGASENTGNWKPSP
ncbi:MAG: hypothetical protein IT432_00725 [Phycisphaerales bacterium]|nr:hypothetical protein [Phycisphaerales bacterium]